MSAPVEQRGFTAVPLKASFFSIGFGFTAIPFENIGSKKMGGGICEGIIECHFFCLALALLISPLKMSAPIKSAETFAGVPLKARCFLFFSVLALLVSPLKPSAPMKWAGIFTGVVPFKASFFFIEFGFAGMPIETVGSNEMGWVFTGVIPLKASFFFIGFGFADIPVENVGSNKMGVGIYEGIIECQFFLFSALALLLSSLKMSAVIKFAGYLRGYH